MINLCLNGIRWLVQRNRRTAPPRHNCPWLFAIFFSAIAPNFLLRNQREESQQEIRQLKERVAELERSRPAGETELKGETISDCSSPSQPRSPTSSEPQPGGENQSSDRREGEGANESSFREPYEKLLASHSELKEPIKEYQQQISLDRLNSSQPPSSEGLKKRTATVNGRPQRAGEKKPLGGQPKPQGRTLSQSADPDHVVNRYPTVGPHGGETIPESSEWDSKPVIRQVIDQKEDSGEIHLKSRNIEPIVALVRLAVSESVPPFLPESKGPSHSARFWRPKSLIFEWLTFCPSDEWQR